MRHLRDGLRIGLSTSITAVLNRTGLGRILLCLLENLHEALILSSLHETARHVMIS